MTIAKHHIYIVNFFALVSNIFNIVGGSCKLRNIIREKQVAKIIEALSNNKIGSEKCLNQESNIIRASDTR